MVRGMGREEIAAQIRARIGAGEWAPGEKLPSTSEFAAELGASEKTTAEAMRSIVAEGLLHTVPGVGRFIPRTDGDTT